MTVEIGPIATIALALCTIAGFVLLFRFFSWWGRATAIARARRIANRLQSPTDSLSVVEDQSAAIDELVQFGNTEAAIAAARELLDSTDGAQRLAAIEILRRTRAFDRWARDLRRGNYRVKVRAIEALGQVGDERAIEELIEVLGDDDPHVAQAASEAVLARDMDLAVDRLAEALSSPNRRVAETAAATLVRVGDDSLEALVGQLGCLDAQARRLSVECLGAVGTPNLVPLLLPLLESDPDSGVRAAVAEAIARTGSKRAFAELRRLAQNDPDWFVRGRVYALLAEMNAPGAAEFLAAGLAGLEPEADRGSDRNDAVEAITEGTRRVRAAIIVGLRLLGLSDDEVAATIRSSEGADLDAAGFSSDDRAASGWSETVAALTQHDPARRADAARQLAEAGMPVLADLRRALRDPDPLVRAEAARSLGRIGASECLNSLADCLLDPDMTVRIASSNAMRAIVTRDAAKELQD
ncbi:MAG: HEAT repeat domain-containing protein [Armatimonadota bacterium]|jgi:HEAT repeat protein